MAEIFYIRVPVVSGFQRVRRGFGAGRLCVNGRGILKNQGYLLLKQKL